MSELEQIGYEMIAYNEPHMACVLLLDTSASMAGLPIQNLNDAILRFKEETSLDELAQKRVDIAVVEFNTEARVVQEFTPISRMEPLPLAARGTTAMAQGIHMAIDMVKERTRFYHSMGTPCYKPWIFMITDGCPDPAEDIDFAAQRIREEEGKGAHGRLKFFALGVAGYDSAPLFALTSRVMELRDTDFTQIFNWLSESMVQISQSRVGEDIELLLLPENTRRADPDRDITDW